MRDSARANCPTVRLPVRMLRTIFIAVHHARTRRSTHGPHAAATINQGHQAFAQSSDSRETPATKAVTSMSVAINPSASGHRPSHAR